MSYLALKHLHVTCVVLSGALFMLRGVWMLQNSALQHQRWVRTLPHIVDTLLLGSALTLAFWSGLYPFVQGWLTAKVIGLIVYVVLGTIALKRGRTTRGRQTAFAAALLVYAYIIGVALTKQVTVF